MTDVLTAPMIAKARELRAKGVKYPEIARQIGYTGLASNIRYHCRDLPTTKKVLKAPHFAESSGIRAFDDDEDEKLIAWAKLPDGERPGFYQLGQQLGRAGASVRARVAWLKKNGRIAAD